MVTKTIKKIGPSGDCSRILYMKRERLQQRFAHYLRSTRLDYHSNLNKGEELSQYGLANILGVSESLIPKLEGRTPYPRVYNSIEFLEQFAKLQGFSLTEFCSVLEDHKLEEKSAFHSELIRKISLKISIKNQMLLDDLLNNTDDLRFINEMFRAMLVIINLPERDRAAVLRILNWSTKKR